jgi:hypothetical protein
MKIRAQGLQAGDVVAVHDWNLHVVFADGDLAVGGCSYSASPATFTRSRSRSGRATPSRGGNRHVEPCLRTNRSLRRAGERQKP